MAGHASLITHVQKYCVYVCAYDFQSYSLFDCIQTFLFPIDSNLTLRYSHYPHPYPTRHIHRIHGQFLSLTQTDVSRVIAEPMTLM